MTSSGTSKGAIEEGKAHPIGIPSSNINSGGNVAGSSAASSVHNKLEQDYIQMYLGKVFLYCRPIIVIYYCH